MLDCKSQIFPPDWAVKNLIEIVDFLDTKRIPIESAKRQEIQGIYPYYGASGIIDYIDSFIFDDDLILLAEDGANILDRSTPIAFRASGKFWVNNHAHVLKPKNNIEIGYLIDYLESLSYKKFNTGSAQPKLNRKICEKIPVLLPPFKQQKKIAEILGTWDEAIALTERAIMAKQKLKKSFSNKFFRIHCPKERIGKLADVKTGGTPSRSEESYWLDGEIPWMSSGEINNRYVNKTKELITDSGFKNSNATLLPKGSVMIALNGQGRTRGSVALLEIETTCNQSLAAIMPNSKILNNEFLFFYLESIYQEIRQLTGDEVRNGLNLKLLREIKIPIPDLTFQKEVASVMRLIDKEIDFLNRYAELINFQKQGLMQKLLTGKWRVTVESEA
jgi:type I restriction enzyme, S subunit